MSSPTQLVDVYQKARSSSEVAVIEGVQALKHAVRFGAEIEDIITCDIELLKKLLEKLAEDISHVILKQVKEVDEATFKKLSPQPPRTKVIARAKRKNYSLKNVAPGKPIVFLEDPRDLENIGAVIRVSAAADAGAVIISGTADIWHPAVIRGAAGLHFAIPTLSLSFSDLIQESSQILESLIKKEKGTNAKNRKLISLDPTGQDITSSIIPNNAIFIFGTERHGISQQLLKQSDQIIRLPMKKGVSSLNLATSVAATLYQL